MLAPVPTGALDLLLAIGAAHWHSGRVELARDAY